MVEVILVLVNPERKHVDRPGIRYVSFDNSIHGFDVDVCIFWKVVLM